ARELTVAVTFPPGTAAELSVDDGAEPFVRDVVQDDGRGHPVEARGTSWFAPACSGGCRTRHRRSGGRRGLRRRVRRPTVDVAPPSHGNARRRLFSIPRACASGQPL